MQHPNSKPQPNQPASAAGSWKHSAERRAASQLRLRALLRWTSICLCVGLVSVAVVHWLAKPEMPAGQWVESARVAPKAPAP